MKKFILVAMAALSLSGCATLGGLKGEITPERCVAALRAADDIKQIAGFLASLGIESELALEVAEYVSAGRIAIAEVCDAVLAPRPPASEAPTSPPPAAILANYIATR